MFENWKKMAWIVELRDSRIDNVTTSRQVKQVEFQDNFFYF
jgi:hypothetical protein